MLPYIVMFTASTFFAYLASHAKRRDAVIFFSAVCILLPSIMGGLRQVGVGFDTRVYGLPHYLAASRASSFMDFLAFDRRLNKELGWAAVMYFSAKALGSINWAFFFYQLITVTCVYIALYKHRKIVPMTFVWTAFFLVMYPTTYNFMRQAVAASIIFLGFDNLEEKRYGRFLIYMFVAALFHTASVIVLSYFLAFHILTTKEAQNTLVRDVLIYSTLLVVIMIRPIMGFIINSSPLFAAYMNYENAVGSSILEGAAIAGLECGELLLCLCYPEGMKRIFAKGDMWKFYRYSLLFHIIYRLCVRVFAYRILYFFDFVNVMILGSLPLLIKEKNLRNLVFVSVIFTLIMFYVSVHVMKDGHATIPYKSVLGL